MIKSKIHCATVTEANLNYMGSITIDEDSGKLIIPSTIPAGEYTIRFSKDKYVPRDYTIVIGETP